MTYKPGDFFEKNIPLSEEGVNIVASIKRNGVTETGTGITSTVIGKECNVSFSIPDSWQARDFISIKLEATLDDETNVYFIEFILESQFLSEVSSQDSTNTLIEDISDLISQDQINTNLILEGLDEYQSILNTILTKMQEVAPGEDPIIMVPAPTPAPQMSAIFLDVLDDGLPVDGIKVHAKLLGNRPIEIDGVYLEGQLISNKRTGHITPGRVIFDTYPGMKYRITSEHLGLDKTVTAPSAGQAINLLNLE